jgi:hypothetical protein
VTSLEIASPVPVKAVAAKFIHALRMQASRGKIAGDGKEGERYSLALAIALNVILYPDDFWAPGAAGFFAEARHSFINARLDLPSLL